MSRFLKENGGAILALALVGAFSYAFNLRGPLFWDDVDWIVNNPSVHSLAWSNIKFIFSHDVLAGIGLVSNYYRPFLFLTFALNYLVSGVEPVLYHLVSNGIHILNSILIFYLLLRWFKSKRAAFLAALLFLIQPLQTEAVAYISGRGDPLSIFFILAGITLYLSGRKWWAYVAATLAILSRETAVLFPAYLGLALVSFELSGTLWKRCKAALWRTLPFIGISSVYGVLRLTVLNFQNTLNFYQQQNLYSEHLAYRIYTFFHALLVYLRLAFWPTGLHMDRDIPVNTSIFVGYAWLGALFIILALSWLIWLYKKGDQRTFYLWFFGLSVFFVNLGPTSGIVPINARIYEHWLYFSLFGFFTVVAWYLDKIWAWFEDRRPSLQPVFVIFLVAYLLFLGVQTIRRNLLWADVPGLYKDILAYEPQDVRILNNLAMWYSDQGNNTAAVPLYEQAIQVDPTQPAPYYNLGNVARDAGQLDQAEVLYKKALTVSPTFRYSYENLAGIYIAQKKYTQALDELKQLQQIYPSPQTAQNIATLEKLISSQ